MPVKEVYYPKEKCHPDSFRTEVYVREGGDAVRLIYCCPREYWNEEKKICEDSMRLHSLHHEDGGEELREERNMPCEDVLERGLTRDVCSDFRGLRRWVMCRTWEMLDRGEESNFRRAMKKAWAEARSTCEVDRGVEF